MYDAGIPRYSETHAGEEVGIYARGPMAHLIHATHEQNYMAHAISYSMCVAPSRELCMEVPPTTDRAAGTHGESWRMRMIVLLMAMFVAWFNRD